MNTKYTLLVLLDIIDGLIDNNTNRTINELIAIKNYLRSRLRKNLHVRSRYNIVSTVMLNSETSFDTYRIVDYRGISKIVGFVCNIYADDDDII